MKDSVKIASIIASSIILVSLIAAFVVFQLIPTSTISVNGQSIMEVVPDVITINFYIETKGDSASEVKDENNIIYNNLVGALGEEGILEQEIKTSSFSVNPEYDWVNGERIEKGYVARHYIKVEQSTNNSDLIGDIIDAGVEAEALISYINFELSEDLEKQKKSEATLKATEDAKIKAESIAEGLGKRLGGIVSVSDSSWNYQPWPLYSAKDDIGIAESGSLARETIQEVSITPDEQMVYGNVAIIYKVR